MMLTRVQQVASKQGKQVASKQALSSMTRMGRRSTDVLRRRVANTTIFKSEGFRNPQGLQSNYVSRAATDRFQRFSTSSISPVEEKVCVVGAGSFGSAIACVLGNSSSTAHVSLWARRQEVADEVNAKRSNSQYTGDDAIFPDKVVATSSLSEALKGASMIVLAVPSAFLTPVLEAVANARTELHPDCVVVSLIKSLHYDSNTQQLATVCTEIEQSLAAANAPMPVMCLMGPNIYREMVRGELAEATIGHLPTHAAPAARVQAAFTTEAFAVELCGDRSAVELCAGLKNVVSLAAGFCEGQGLGGNIKAAIIRAGLTEMSRLIKMITGGGEGAVFKSAAGVGDLILTCNVGRGRVLAAAFVNNATIKDESPHDRWARLEDELFQGMKLPDWHNAQAVQAFLQAKGIAAEFPLFSTVHRVGFENAEASQIVDTLRVPSPPIEGNAEKVSPPSLDLKGQRALVTGAGRGIGKALAAFLTRCGARVIALDVDPQALEEVRNELGLEDTVCVDLMDTNAIEKEIADLLERGGPVQLLVNNAGIACFEPYFETSMKMFDLHYGVNVRAAVLITQLLTKALVDAKLPGSVVHVSSQSSTLALTEHLVYSSSKAAIDHISRIQALELGRYGIRVNTVRPTVVMTELSRKAWAPDKLEVMKNQIPLRELAEPEDVAASIAFLLSDQARMITGSTLAVDGGRSMGGYGL